MRRSARTVSRCSISRRFSRIRRPRHCAWAAMKDVWLRAALRAGLVAPAFPCRALVVANFVVLEHGSDERGNVGLVIALALLKFPFVVGREHGRFGKAKPFHGVDLTTRHCLRSFEALRSISARGFRNGATC